MTPKHPKTGRFLREGLFDGLQSFAELERRLNPLSENDKGDAFEVFAEAYCRLTPEIGAAEFWPERATPAEVRRSSIGGDIHRRRHRRRHVFDVASTERLPEIYSRSWTCAGS